MDSATPVITSTRNRRVVEARKLYQRKHRQRQQSFLVEGLQSLHMTLDAGLVPREVFYCQELFVGTEASALMERFATTGADLVPVSEQVMGALSQRSGPQGIVAVLPFLDTPWSELELGENALVVVLDRPQDPGNLGTLIRTADAVGAAAIALLTPCVDVFDPKAVRASMGSLFNLPVLWADDAATLFDNLADRGLRPVGADPERGKLWGQALWEGKVALVLGNEAAGLSEDVRPYLNDWARLPIRGDADSLNIAVAGGVLMYLWLQARMARS